jgi:hypothetical protein
MRSGRKRINLDGKWRFDMFGCEPEDLAEVEPGRTIDVPACVKVLSRRYTREVLPLLRTELRACEAAQQALFSPLWSSWTSLKVFLNARNSVCHREYLPFEFE